MAEMSVWVVVVAAFITAVATGLGALPFLFVQDISNWWLGVFNAVAGGSCSRPATASSWKDRR